MVRIFDLIGSDLGTTTTKQILKNNTLYNPSNVGGGYVRAQNGSLVSSRESITFDCLFKTDAESHGYQKYFETCRDLSDSQIVWLRYGIPDVLSDGYLWAYRPCVVSSITKTEGSKQQASLVEKITLQTLAGWQMLYKFTQAQAASSLRTSNASIGPDVKLFSNDAKVLKATPFSFPFWYGAFDEDDDDISDVLKAFRTRNRWYDRWGNVLSSDSDVYQIFAIHAPAITISQEEDEVLGYFETSLEKQTKRMKGRSFSSSEIVVDDPRVQDFKKTFTNLRKFKNKGKSYRKHQNFKSSLQSLKNFAVSTTFPIGSASNWEYASFHIQGSASPSGSLLFKANGVTTNGFVFREGGAFVIDSADFADIYPTNADMRYFLKTTAKENETIQCQGVNLTSIIMRREMIGV